ncbi:MAG: methyltransferase domain-containing protein [Anaerolineales bacterium]|nr:MAG: methyltransferase domain-containing protein [Anaerolineales bacterium]
MGIVRLAHRYLVQQTMPGWVVAHYDRMIESVAELYLAPFCEQVFAAFPGATRIVDAGTGTGVLPVILAHGNPDYRVTGIDLSEKCLQVGRERASKEGVADRVDFQRANLERCPGESGSVAGDQLIFTTPLQNSHDVAQLSEDVWPPDGRDGDGAAVGRPCDGFYSIDLEHEIIQKAFGRDSLGLDGGCFVERGRLPDDSHGVPFQSWLCRWEDRLGFEYANRMDDYVRRWFQKVGYSNCIYLIGAHSMYDHEPIDADPYHADFDWYLTTMGAEPLRFPGRFQYYAFVFEEAIESHCSRAEQIAPQGTTGGFELARAAVVATEIGRIVRDRTWSSDIGKNHIHEPDLWSEQYCLLDWLTPVIDGWRYWSGECYKFCEDHCMDIRYGYTPPGYEQ